METDTDSSVMQRVQAGEIAHLAVLFERYHQPLFRYLLGLTGNRTVSEDLVQDAFFRVLKHAHTYDSTQLFPAWLYGMARNAYFDLSRKMRREAAPDELDSVKSAEPMVEETLTRKQDEDLLHRALAKLPAEKREVLILSRFDGLRYEEIGRILGCEVGAVKVRVYRALKELRERFCELQGERVCDC